MNINNFVIAVYFQHEFIVIRIYEGNAADQCFLSVVHLLFMSHNHNTSNKESRKCANSFHVRKHKRK